MVVLKEKGVRGAGFFASTNNQPQIIETVGVTRTATGQSAEIVHLAIVEERVLITIGSRRDSGDLAGSVDREAFAERDARRSRQGAKVDDIVLSGAEAADAQTGGEEN